MLTSKLTKLRMALVVLITVFGISPFANVQFASAQSPSPTIGVVCTYGPNFSLDALPGYIQMSDASTMYMWSYQVTGGIFQYPGPVLCVTEGDTVTITLHNHMGTYLNKSIFTSIMFPGQDNVQADGALAQPDLANNSLTNGVADGGSITYSFVANRPGTFIYESGTDTRMQTTMGLVGALIVRPAAGDNFVYNLPSTQFTPSEDFMALLTELDPYQHQAVESNKSFNMNNYEARYWMINGRGFPDTLADNFASWLPNQPYGSLARIYPYDGNQYLADGVTPNPSYHPYPAVERFINLGTEEYPFHPHGQNGILVGRDGYPLNDGQDLSLDKYDFNIGPGQTWDVLFKWHDAEGYVDDPNGNNIEQHLQAVGQTMPDLVNLTLGMFYSGSAYLGEKPTLPPGASTLNQCGEYYIISHNHALFQLDAFGQTMSGQITYLRVDPPLAQQQANNLFCNN